MSGLLANLADEVRRISPLGIEGRVLEVVGLSIIVEHFPVAVGSRCSVRARATQHTVRCEVVGFRSDQTLLMALDEMDGVSRGDVVHLTSRRQTIGVGDEMLGRVINGLGEAIDGRGPVRCSLRRNIEARAISALSRERIEDAIGTGIRAIDACMTCGRGQRVGIFSGAGVGKSVLLGMMARYTSAHVNVICLAGERGREVREFIERDLGPDGLRRSVVVVSTNDEPPLMKIKAALVAHTLAEHFRDEGRDVLLMLDSVTRLAMAQRQVGLSAGEPPTTKGYPPSVFSLLPRILERAGKGCQGSITGFYTILVEGDDMSDPVADAVRSILDGHLVLSRRLANQGHYPAIDVTQSISRLMTELVEPKHLESARTVVRLLAAYNEVEDLVNIGAYSPGSNPEVDLAVASRQDVLAFLRQGINEAVLYDEAGGDLEGLVRKLDQARKTLQAKRGAQAAAVGTQP
ncbi:MAG: FliI/YscN family ATPase [Planctomycetes bacterium]|nr:FliI/YscN family ATPase [Planctomycetota bacterium]